MKLQLLALGRTRTCIDNVHSLTHHVRLTISLNCCCVYQFRHQSKCGDASPLNYKIPIMKPSRVLFFIFPNKTLTFFCLTCKTLPYRRGGNL